MLSKKYFLDIERKIKNNLNKKKIITPPHMQALLCPIFSRGHEIVRDAVAQWQCFESKRLNSNGNKLQLNKHQNLM